MNKCMHVGRFVYDPELKSTANGLKIAKFRMAVQVRKDDTDFLDFVAFGKTAEFIEKYFDKGKPASTMSRAKVESWETEDGQKRSKVVFYVDEINFVPGSKTETVSNNDGVNLHDDDNDTPF